MEAPATEAMSPDKRKQVLAGAISHSMGGNSRIESQSDYQAVIIRGKRPNHILHLILTILTFGLWAIVWIIVTLSGGEKRTMVTVDDSGVVSYKQL